MTEQKLIHTVDILLTIAVVITLHSLVFIVCLFPQEKQKARKILIPLFKPMELESVDIHHDVESLKPPVKEPERPKMKEPNKILLKLYSLEIHYQTMEFEYVGRHFITAYCPEECGYNGNNYPTGWRTSSDTICHYSNDWEIPTTCAIDRGFHKYGEVILVGDPYDPNNRKIYITEDTGPGVKGLWIDCFVETMDEVRRWDTRYDSVWNVTYIDHTITVGEMQHWKEMAYMEEQFGKYWYKEVKNGIGNNY